ncbi:MAG: hypothetical protein WBX01_08790 [Nitrososphaeraceae archaeon]
MTLLIVDGLEQVQDYSNHIHEKAYVSVLSKTKLKVEPEDNTPEAPS